MRGAPGSNFRTWFLRSATKRLDLWLLLFGGLRHIAVDLQLMPDFGVGAKGRGKTQRHIGRDVGLAVENAGERGPRNMQMVGGR